MCGVIFLKLFEEITVANIVGQKKDSSLFWTRNCNKWIDNPRLFMRWCLEHYYEVKGKVPDYIYDKLLKVEVKPY